MVWRLIDPQSNLQVGECQKIWLQHLEAASRSFEEAKWVAHDFEVLDAVMRANHGVEYTIAEFNPIQWTFDNSPQILVPIANGSEEMEAVMIIDILRRAKANVAVASGGLGGAQAFAKSDKLVNMLKKQKESNRPYDAICASPALVLEPRGLLKGKKATAFPAMCNKLSDQSEIENRVVVDGNLITSRGPGTSMEFALAVVEKFFGRNKALELAKIMLFTRA
ncbi:hypothetical protein WN944_014229 [Citrus x changshan-huyou]|uniref:DJ-1/PfpI domain-containing protein n=1 Tax=Citrus x changshan-huyou TaxID=2935761 RepID=A0AAP0QPV5_9ROSI